MRGHRERIRDERGIALVITALVLTAVLGMAAFGVDLAMMQSARGEAQRAADAAALAGASAFGEGGETGEVAEAEARAVEFAQMNQILGAPITADEVEVTVDEASSTVRVEILRAAVPTLFARALGVTSVAVGARAAARSTNAVASTCVKPFALPDPSTVAAPSALSGGSGSGGGQGNGYAYGQQMVLRGTGAQTVMWVVPDDAGSTGPCSERGAAHSPPRVESNICNCNRSTVDLEQTYSRPAGWQGNGVANFAEEGSRGLRNQDSGAQWDPTSKKIVGSAQENWRESPRIMAVPLYDASAGGEEIRFTRFAYAFLESIDSDGTIRARYLGVMRTIQLVE